MSPGGGQAACSDVLFPHRPANLFGVELTAFCYRFRGIATLSCFVEGLPHGAQRNYKFFAEGLRHERYRSRGTHLED